MQLPAANELVLVCGIQPIRAKKARYFEDRRLQERILPLPSLTSLCQRLPKAARDEWSNLPVAEVDPKPVLTESSDEILTIRGSGDNRLFPSMRRSRRIRLPWWTPYQRRSRGRPPSTPVMDSIC